MYRFRLLLVPLALASFANAGQLVQGDQLRAFYGDMGVWNDPGAAAGLQVRHGDTWVDYTWYGYPFATWRLAWEDGGSAPEEYFVDTRIPSANAELLDADDLSTATMKVARHVYRTGGVRLQKTEVWPADGTTMLLHYYVRNDDSRTLTDMRLLVAVDPDQDYSATAATLNGVLDIDEDGLPDMAWSAGPNTGHTMAFGACTPAEVGHFTNWTGVFDALVDLSDQDGNESDSAMGLRAWPVGDLAPGAGRQISVLVTFGDTWDQAVEAFLDERDLCTSCDRDADGWLDPDCGGRDCDDSDASVNPAATDVPYDGVDADCDGASDYDADRDGFDSDAHGGDDCDDADPAVHPGATDEPYDNVDADCAGDSDLDGDGDGYDSGGHGGTDCNDGDAAIHPDAADLDGDGVDSDCDGNDGPAPDTDVVGDGCGCATGAPSGLVWALLPLLALRRRQRPR